MKTFEDDALRSLLRIAVDDNYSPALFTRKLNSREWQELHSVCIKQLMAGVVYRAICKLPKEQRPPLDLIFQWASEAETIKGHNKLLNEEAARLTELFAAEGRKTAVLKGSANARLYPDPNMRQAGDIDLWVDGGKKSVLALMQKMGYEIKEKDLISEHHVHLHPVESDVTVEVHYRPSSGNLNPFSNAHLMRFLESEIQNVEKVPEGFNVPSIKFALAMQLSHIQRHFLAGGIGFKQLLDYYMLLLHSTESDRKEIASQLSRFGLAESAAALMWIMEYMFALDASKMLCKPDKRRGIKMLDEVYAGGNFGKHRNSPEKEARTHFALRWLKRRIRSVSMFWFAPAEVLGHEFSYWRTFIRSIPFRIKMRRVSIWDIYQQQYDHSKKA